MCCQLDEHVCWIENIGVCLLANVPTCMCVGVYLLAFVDI